MTDTRIRAPRATDLLREDHRKVRRLFDEFGKLPLNDLNSRGRAFERVHETLRVHARIEDEIFYPALGEDGIGEDAADLLEEAREAHEEIDALLEEIADLPPEDAGFDARMDALRDVVDRHVKDEERDLFPLFLDLDEEVQEEVAERLLERRDELTRD